MLSRSWYTSEDVINRLLDAYEKKDGAPSAAAGNGAGGDIRRFNPVTPPDLTHTKVLTIEFHGEPLDRRQANWNALLDSAVRKAKSEAKSATELKRLVFVNLEDGKKTDKGYRFLPDVNLSVQGQDTNGAWKAVCHIAQQLGCQLKVTFVWSDREGAAFPGVTGQFSIAGR